MLSLLRSAGEAMITSQCEWLILLIVNVAKKHRSNEPLRVEKITQQLEHLLPRALLFHFYKILYIHVTALIVAATLIAVA